MEHLWQKMMTAGPNDSSIKTITRTWRCKHCGGSKTRVTRKADSAPRKTVELSVSVEKCGAVVVGGKVAA